MIDSNASLKAAMLVLLLAVAGCASRPSSVEPYPSADIFDPVKDDAVGRTFECTSRGDNGQCNVNECRQGPGGATFDCASFAALCVEAGQHWTGTREGGKCTRVL
jgi:hypothetical protein